MIYLPNKIIVMAYKNIKFSTLYFSWVNTYFITQLYIASYLQSSYTLMITETMIIRW